MKYQKGSSLLFTLIILVAMLFGTISMFKSVDMSTVVAGNLAFKEGSVNASDVAVKMASDTLKNMGGAFDVSDATKNYYAIQRKTTPDGIPCSLPITSTEDCKPSNMSWGTETKVGTNKVYHLIDRLYVTSTEFSGSSIASGQTYTNRVGRVSSVSNSSENTSAKPPNNYTYRVTVKILGPNNTESYVQATL